MENQTATVQRSGWDGHRFHLPFETLEPANDLFAQVGCHAVTAGSAGSLEGWQKEVAAPAGESGLGVMAISLAICGPLMSRLGAQNGGIHIWGGTSQHRTTLSMLAASVWGDAGNYIRSWREVGHRLEGVVKEHCDTVLCIDNNADVDAAECGTVAYLLAWGHALPRIKSGRLLGSAAEWRFLYLTTGEDPLADFVMSSRSGRRPLVGYDLHVLDLPVDQGLGVVAGNADTLDSADFPGKLVAAAQANYGHAGPAVVRAILDRGDDIVDQMNDVRKRFFEIACQKDDTSQVVDAVTRFGLLAAAGEVAAYLGIVPWNKDHAFSQMLHLFHQWAATFGRKKLSPDMAVVWRLVDAINENHEKFGTEASEFWKGDTLAGRPEGEDPALRTWGVFLRRQDRDYYVFHSAGWRRVFRDMDIIAAAAYLKLTGFVWGYGTRSQRPLRVRGKLVPMYWVPASMINA